MEALITETAIAGAITALPQVMAHYHRHNLRLHPVANYTIGSVFCLLGLSAVFLSRGSWQPFEVIFLAWGIWGINGLFVLVTYLLDGFFARKRLLARLESVKGASNENRNG